MPRYIKTNDSHTFLNCPTGLTNTGITWATDFRTVSQKYDSDVIVIDVLFYDDSGTIRVVAF